MEARYQRLIIYGVPALTFFFFEIIFQAPKTIFLLGGLLLLLFLFAIHLILGSNLKNPSARFKFFVIPALLTLSALGFSLLLETALPRHLLAVLVAIFLVLFFESMVTYVWHHELYKAFSLENLAAYALTLTVFLGSGALFGFSVLLDINTGIIALLAIVLLFAVHRVLFWISKLPSVPSSYFSYVLTFVLLEGMLALRLLPFHFMVLAALTTIFWYTGALMARAHLMGLLTSKMVYRHIGLGGALLLVLVLAVILR